MMCCEEQMAGGARRSKEAGVCWFWGLSALINRPRGNRIQKPAQSFLQGSPISGLAFPDHENGPAKGSQAPAIRVVPQPVRLQFGRPVLGAGCRYAALAAGGVAVPETTVNLDHLPQPGEDQIGFSREVPNVETIPVSHRMNHAANDQFRSRVLTSNPAHIFRAAIRGK